MAGISHLFSRKPGAFTNRWHGHSDACLPLSSTKSSSVSRFQFKALLGNCLYRRVIIWTLVISFLTAITMFNPRLTVTSKEVLEYVGGNIKGELRHDSRHGEGNGLQLQAGNDIDHGKQAIFPEGEGILETFDPEEEEEVESVDGPHWLRYKHLDGYFTGLRDLVPYSAYKPEYPKTRRTKSTPFSPVSYHEKPSVPSVYRAHPDYNSEEWQRKYVPVSPCFVDPEKQVPAPDLYAYRGLPQGQPKAAIGSHELLGLRDDVCFDRFSRYGPYGLGYNVEDGGTGEALDTEREGSQVIWEKSGKIDWSKVDWASAQQRCYARNHERFYTGNETRDDELARTGRQKLDRIAVVIRTYVGFKWTPHAILNFRAMISELNLRSGGEYDVHFLLHVRDNNAPIWADPKTAQDLIDANVPAEFRGLCTLWSEAQMRLYYPGNFGDTFENPSNGDIHGVYRSAHMPLQHFANLHPEYAHFWNWEMDMRSTGSYYELFDRLGKWGAKQSRQGMWERSAKYYIPALHGSWENFTEVVAQETRDAKKEPVLGPVLFPGKADLEHGDDFMPESCAVGSDKDNCGVGEDADLITLNPLFDTEESGWVFAADVTGYDTSMPKPPRRCAIVTASRLSRRLLSAMHEETWRLHHSMFSEMFPPAMAFHHGLKAVYAPHPVFLDRKWPQKAIEKAFNGGSDHNSGGSGSPFDLNNEHNHKGTTWYYNSEFAGLLWRRWLGYAQMDGRGEDGGRAGQGTLRGGLEEEKDPANSGRLCLRSMLLHPIKWENPNEQDGPRD
ncbi:hypothetical protein F4780DRAFT_716783 [Xylariomycetidae sp. FL0641]|nr:hypothetical protein F4780DRAFT_716783 [Xylariomycetidae sp. FL0641]